ncbi:hypothetical protein KAI31_01840, partial [Candidatus Bathyarchaeota archaeon]|nr:hypothetical protein [Candidatus Bathyarchaeota archaeon]
AYLFLAICPPFYEIITGLALGGQVTVPLIIRLSMGVKASMRGVNKTPPPIPAITAMMAMVKLSRKNPKVKRATLFRDIPPGGVSAPFDMSARAIYDRVTTTHNVVNSSQGDLSSFFTFSL